VIRFRLEKRKPLPGWAKIVIPIAAIVVTLILSAIPILIAGASVEIVFLSFLRGSGNTLQSA
jgi:ABC-type uncharacterized transport system permease subunit